MSHSFLQQEVDDRHIIPDFLVERKNICRKEDNFMAKNTKQTSRKVATTASKVLRDNRYSKAAKTAAASALVQTKPKK